jgi:hypothetical protein
MKLIFRLLMCLFCMELARFLVSLGNSLPVDPMDLRYLNERVHHILGARPDLRFWLPFDDYESKCAVRRLFGK